jgi:hypothetical protein
LSEPHRATGHGQNRQRGVETAEALDHRGAPSLQCMKAQTAIAGSPSRLIERQRRNCPLQATLVPVCPNGSRPAPKR